MEELEVRVKAACSREDYDEAATALLEGYGPEVLGFLCAVMSDYDKGGDAFGQLSEDLWKGLPNFRWQCSARTWVYKLARNASHRHRRDAYRKRRQGARSSIMNDLAHRVCTRTLPFIKTETKDRFRQLRQALTETDRMVLILRVDRKLSWKEVSEVMHSEEGESHSVPALKMRFTRIKKQLRDLAEEAGLLSE